MLTQAAAALLLLATSVLATPVVVRDSPVTLPFARRLNVTGGRDIMRMDQARAKSLRVKSLDSSHVHTSEADVMRKAVGAAFGVPSTNQGVDYIVQVNAPFAFTR